MTASALDVKAALVASLTDLFPDPVLVTWGRPGKFQPDDIVMVMGQRTVTERGPSGPRRPREDVVSTDVVFSIYRPGDETQQRAASDRAYQMLETFQEWLRTRPNEELGGACREAHVAEHSLVESPIVANTKSSDLVVGYTAVLAAVVESRTRS